MGDGSVVLHMGPKKILGLGPKAIRVLRTALSHAIASGAFNGTEIALARAEDIFYAIGKPDPPNPGLRWEKSGRTWRFFDGRRLTGTVRRVRDGYQICQRDLHGWRELTRTATLVGAKRRVETAWSGKPFTRVFP